MDEQKPQNKQAERISRQYKRMQERERRLEERRAASAFILKLFKAWAETREGSQRTFDRMQKEVVRLCKEIETNTRKYPHIDEASLDGYFTQLKERVVSSTLPRKRVTYQQMLAALREVVVLNTEWLQAQPRSKAEQAQMLQTVRQLLLEIEAGHIEDMAERFRRTTE